MDDDTREKIGVIVQRAADLPEPPQDLTPEEQTQWLVRYLVEDREHPVQLSPELKAILDACTTHDEMFQALGAYTAKAVRSD